MASSGWGLAGARGGATLNTHDFMIDIETLGQDPRRHPMIMVAAVRFDLHFNEIDHYCACIGHQPGLVIDERAELWWKDTDIELLARITALGRDPGEVARELSQYFHREPGDIRLWAWPTTFDLPFVHEFIGRHWFRNPTRKGWVDCRSWIQGRCSATLDDTNIMLHRASDQPDEPIKGRLVDRTHDALYDARWQLDRMRMVLRGD